MLKENRQTTVNLPWELSSSFASSFENIKAGGEGGGGGWGLIVKPLFMHFI